MLSHEIQRPRRDSYRLRQALKRLVPRIVILLVFVCSSALGDSVLVSDVGGVKVFDALSAAYMGIFGETDGFSLGGLAIHPVSGNLLGTREGSDPDDDPSSVLEFDGATGALVGAFGQTEGNVS